MKVSLVMILLLGFYAACVPTEARYAKRRYDTSSEEEASNKIVQCQTAIMGCAAPVMKYNAPDHVTSAQKFRDAGPQQVCNDMMPVAQCAYQKLTESVCSNYPDYYKIIFSKAVRMTTLLCIDKIDALKKHWNCLIGAQAQFKVPPCTSEAEQMAYCNPEPLTNCMANLFKNMPGCDSGADDFVREIFPLAIGMVAPHCPDRQPILAQAFLDFMKFK